MPYSTSNPPRLLVGAFNATANTNSLWSYNSTDAATAVDASGYITNARELGMVVGDLVYHTKTDATPVTVDVHRVVAINANGSADLTNANAVIVGTNSD